MSMESKPTTVMSKENMDNFKRGWDRIFGKKRIVVTFEHDHSTYSDLWHNYYSQYFDTLKVVKIGDLLRDDWGGTTKLLNSMQSELFSDYDLIMFVDVDEIVIPDPDKYKDLGEYLDQVDCDVVRCTGYNVIEMPEDKTLDITKPILTQRKYWQHDPMYDKYVIITKPQNYISNHTIKKGCTPDKDLVMFHLRDTDLKTTRERNAKIGHEFNEKDLATRRSQATLIPDKWKTISFGS